ncbi:MAG: endonuclease/exonuclease/phosphatase family protein [Colwellia sp.]|nr:endonuclease/exonuclease/phosphatase family protein [Colwellia sp.]
MFIPKSFPKQLNSTVKSVNKCFSLLLWNIHKENQNSAFKQTLLKLLVQHPSDFLLFQEVKYSKNTHFFLRDDFLAQYDFLLASNIEKGCHVFGVMTASKYGFKQVTPSVTCNKELGLFTHKSQLVSHHPLSNRQSLCLVNLHAINFVSNKVFNQELTHLTEQLRQFLGPMIFAGDFNTWSKSRLQQLEQCKRTLSLSSALVAERHHIKHFFSKPLDHLLYRGLELIQAQAIDTLGISDHNPIHAHFILLPS